MMPGKETVPDRNRYPVTEQLRFERLISEMATVFVNLPIDRIDREIENALHHVAEFFEVDRSTIFTPSDQPHTLEVVHTYASEDIDPAAGLDIGKRFPWCWQKLRLGELIAISSLEELPDKATIDLESMKQFGVQSFIGVPVRIEGGFRFVFTLTCLKQPHTWHPDLLNRIQLAGQLLGNALHRKETETRLAQIAAENSQFQNALFHRDRIGTIGALTATIAHEINQPLAAILSNAQAALQFLSRTPPDLEEVRQILADIVSDDNRASAVIHNVRNLLKNKERHTERIFINEVVSIAVHMTRSETVLREIPIIQDLNPQNPPVFGDPILIQQVILNLLINAMDAMKGMENKTARITIQTRSDEIGWIDVHVCDTGPGIAKTVQNAMFKTLYTTKPDGLGIGLILCRSIIEAHGGTLSAENCPEGGARDEETSRIGRIYCEGLCNG